MTATITLIFLANVWQTGLTWGIPAPISTPGMTALGRLVNNLTAVRILWQRQWRFNGVNLRLTIRLFRFSFTMIGQAVNCIFSVPEVPVNARLMAL